MKCRCTKSLELENSVDPLRVFLSCTRAAGVLACFRADIRDSRQGGSRSAALAIRLAHAYTVLLTNVRGSFVSSWIKTACTQHQCSRTFTVLDPRKHGHMDTRQAHGQSRQGVISDTSCESNPWKIIKGTELVHTDYSDLHPRKHGHIEHTIPGRG